MNNFLKDKVLN